MADFTDEDDDLLAELGIEIEEKKTAALTPREERIIAGFEDIQRFVDEQGRPPLHGGPLHSASRDIFERLYAVRLDRLRISEEARTLLMPLDRQGLLADGDGAASDIEEMDDDALLAELGVETDPPDLTVLRHVRGTAEKRAAEEIANRDRCPDFDTFAPLFEKVQREIGDGTRETRAFVKDAGFQKRNMRAGQFFILGGQTAYIAEVGDIRKAPNGENDARLRVVFSNGTESNLLLRSFQRALYEKDNHGRWITEPPGPLFSGEATDDDEASGTIYVLRSKSDHPMVADNRELIHKIGVTGTDVEKRIAGAHLQPTFLMAPVEIVATYELYSVNRTKMENLIHRIFGPAKLDIEIKDRFGKPVTPREWFLVPLFAIDEAVERIRDGTIEDYIYAPDEARLKSTR